MNSSNLNQMRKLKIERDLIADPNDPRYEFVKNTRKVQSGVWLKFDMVKFEGQFENFARCRNCKELLVYLSRSGTGSLLRHTCKGFLLGHQQNQEEYQLLTSNNKRPKLSEPVLNNSFENQSSVKEKINRNLMPFIVKDLRPLGITEGDGFTSFAQSLINLGAEYGYQDFNNLGTSMFTSASIEITKDYNALKAKLGKILQEENLAFTIDTWTSDECKQKNFTSLTTCFIDSEFQMKTYFLGIRYFSTDEKTHANIRELIFEILFHFNIGEKMHSAFVVTCNASNVVNAFQNYKVLPCACHNLNLAIEDVLNKPTDEDLIEINCLIEASKELADYFQHARLNEKLKKSLKQPKNTRWDSKFLMLESILEMHKEIQQVLMDVNEIHLLTSIDYNLLQSLVEFLVIFKKCSKHLSSDMEPTIHVYSLWFHKLMRHCCEYPQDSQVLRKLKKVMHQALLKRMKPLSVHNVALFLNPNFKKLQFLPQDEQKQIVANVKTMLQLYCGNSGKIKLELEAEETDEVYVNEINEVDVPATTASLEIFEEFRDQTSDCEQQQDLADVELKYYSDMVATEFCDDPGDVLQFWREAKCLPLLRRLARDILNVPASSAASERLFSNNDRIMEKRRSRLCSEDVEKILFLNKNL